MRQTRLSASELATGHDQRGKWAQSIDSQSGKCEVPLRHPSFPGRLVLDIPSDIPRLLPQRHHHQDQNPGNNGKPEVLRTSALEPAIWTVNDFNHIHARMNNTPWGARKHHGEREPCVDVEKDHEDTHRCNNGKMTTKGAGIEGTPILEVFGQTS